jgi:hypothetical protein
LQKHKIELITNESGDWIILKLNDEFFAEGHSIYESEWLDLIKEINPDIQIKQIEITDEQMENCEY